MKKVIILLFLYLPVSIHAASDLPFAAGICVSKANRLIQEQKIDQAVLVLKTFSEKQQEASEKEAASKGYDHYYIDFLIGNCFLMLNQQNADPFLVEKAALAYENAVKKNPLMDAAWLNLAKSRYEQGQMLKAGAAFKKGYETGELKKPSHLYYASVCYSLSGKHEKALLIFNDLISNHPEDIKLSWKETLVNIYFFMGKNRQALQWIEELAEKTKGSQKKKWQEVLLYQYLTLKMNPKAIDYARFLTRTDPCEPKWWKALTHIHLEKNRLEDGLASLMIYGFIVPLSQQEINLAADLYMACGIPLKAARYYEGWVEKILAQKGNKERASQKANDQILDMVRKLSSAYLSGFEQDAALQWIEKGLGIKVDPDLLRMKADFLFQKKEYKIAYQTYEKLSEFQAYKGVGSLMMGYAAWNEGRVQKAKNAFTAALEFKDQKKAACNALTQLQAHQRIQ